MTTIENSSVSPWRIPTTEDINIDIKELRKKRYYYFRLESESSRASEDDTESIYSLQDKDTDVISDSSDVETETSNINEEEYELEFEYEVASLSESEDIEVSTTDSEGMMLAAAAAVIMCDSSLEPWVTVTDVEDSGTSSDDTSFGRTDFIACVQCKGENRNPLYRYCEKCFQNRKKFFPPRPRRNRRKNQTKEDKRDHVKLDTLKNCLSGLSQDSGIASSQECPSLGLDKIVIPDYLQKPGTSKAQDSYASTTEVLKESEFKAERNTNLRRKRQSSESSLSEYEVKKPKIASKQDALKPFSSIETSSLSETSGFHSEKSNGPFFSDKSSSFDSDDKSKTELCIFCNSAPKDSIFLHTNIAHRCCCYPCAKNHLKSVKRCPICNRTVNKVVRIFTS